MARLHKHFDLKEDEKVVWRFGERSYSTVEKGGNWSPCVIQLTEGQVTPTEFYEGKNLWSEIEKDKNFKEWTNKIKEIIKDENYLYGLTLNLSQHVNELELTDEKNRTQEIISREKGVKSEGQVTTKFYKPDVTGECDFHVGSCVHCCRK